MGKPHRHRPCRDLRLRRGDPPFWADASLVATVSADYYIQSGSLAGTAVNVWVRSMDTRNQLSAAVGPLSVTPTEPIAPEGTTFLRERGHHR